MDESPEEAELPQSLKVLRRLVTALTATLIIGFITLIALFVTRLGERGTASVLPDEIVLPEGARALAFTRARDWYAVTTTDDEILIFDAATGELRQRIKVESGGQRRVA